MMSGFLSWLDASPIRFEAAAWVAFSMAAAAAVGGALPWGAKRWWRHPALFAGLALLSILAFRWPLLCDNRELVDPDESQMMSGALTLSHDSAFWRSVDCNTAGPIDEWPLLGLLRLGGRVDYTGARMIIALLGWVDVLCAWLALRHLLGDGVGRLGVLPLLAFHAFADFWGFVQYGSEQVPCALIALASVLLITGWNASGSPRRRWRILAAGLVLGAVPFAKLQLAPVAAWAGAFAIAQICLEPGSGGRSRFRDCAGMVACGFAVPALMLLWILARGLWADFLASYVVDNLRYAGARWFPWAETPGKFYELCGMAPGFKPFILGAGGMAACALAAWPWMGRWHRRWAVYALGLTLVSIFAAMAPGRLFQHYLQIIVFPAGLLAGVLAGAAIEATRRLRKSPAPLRRLLPALAILLPLALGLIPQIAWRLGEAQAGQGRFAATRGVLQISGVAREILRHAQPGERLGIWGWCPALWMQTGMVQATRDGNTARQIDLAVSRPAYLARYMADLKLGAPPVFVDAVGDGNFTYHDRAVAGHEMWDALNVYIRTNYRQVADIEAMRIYVRNDRP